LREHEWTARRGELDHQDTNDQARSPARYNITPNVTDQRAENLVVEIYYGDDQEQKDYVEIWSGYPSGGKLVKAVEQRGGQAVGVRWNSGYDLEIDEVKGYVREQPEHEWRPKKSDGVSNVHRLGLMEPLQPGTRSTPSDCQPRDAGDQRSVHGLAD
jgi:hypothetical protein